MDHINSRQIANNIYAAKKGERTLLYAPFKNLVVKRTSSLGGIQEIIVRLGKDLFSVPQNLRAATVVELDLSHRCSLNCKYCSVDSNHGLDSGLTLSLDDAKIGIDIVFENSAKHSEPWCVVLVGKGEPTTYWSMIEQISKYLEDKRRIQTTNGQYVIVTNGIVSPKRAEYIAHKFDHIGLSWDGLEHDHDYQRPLLNGKGSYRIVERTARILQRSKAWYEIRATISNRNVMNMLKMTEHFLEYSPSLLNYQPLFRVGRARGCGLEMPTMDAFIDMFAECRKLAYRRGVRVIMPSADITTLSRKSCHAYEGTGLHVTANGSLTACECVFDDKDELGKLFCFGHIADGKVNIDEDKINALKQCTVDSVRKCHDCFIRWHCAGGCVNTHIASGRNISDDRTHDGCEISRQVVWDALWDIADGNCTTIVDMEGKRRLWGNSSVQHS